MWKQHNSTTVQGAGYFIDDALSPEWCWRHRVSSQRSMACQWARSGLRVMLRQPGFNIVNRTEAEHEKKYAVYI